MVYFINVKIKLLLVYINIILHFTYTVKSYKKKKNTVINCYNNFYGSYFFFIYGKSAASSAEFRTLCMYEHTFVAGTRLEMVPYINVQQ